MTRAQPSLASRGFDLWDAPFDGAATLGWPGSRYAPAKIRHAMRWILQRRENERIYCLDDAEIHHFPDDLIIERGDAGVIAHDVETTLTGTAAAIRESAHHGRVPILLGGDDSLLFPVVRAIADSTDGTVAVVHFDAHLDLLDANYWQGRWSHSSGMRRALEIENVDPARSIQVGSRHFNFPSSMAVREQYKLANIPASQIHRVGVEQVVAQVLEHLAGAGHVVLAFDIDVVDPAHAPGAGAHEPGGLSSFQALEAVRLLAPYCHGLALTEVNPLLDVADRTANLAAYLIAHFAVHGAVS